MDSNGELSHLSRQRFLLFSLFLSAGKEVRSLTFVQLQHYALRVAEIFGEEGESAAREAGSGFLGFVLLLLADSVLSRIALVYQPGLDFVIGICGCFYAGCAAVPLAPPLPEQFEMDLDKLNSLVGDCGATVALVAPGYHFLFKSKVMWLGDSRSLYAETMPRGANSTG